MQMLKRAALVLLAMPLVLAGCVVPGVSKNATDLPVGIEKIQHVVIIMQENRSFDSYFGTYPGADGIPMTDGVPTACLNDPLTNSCVRPYHDPTDSNHGAPTITPPR